MQKNLVTLRERTHAALIHLILSACILTGAVYLVFGVWYPSSLDSSVGVTSIYIIILTADLILGPTLTFIIYKHEKKRLRFDLTIILLLQISAFIYGMSAVEQGRPAWLVFVVDDFELVSPADIKANNRNAEQSEFKVLFWSGPQWIAAQYSKDQKTLQQQKEDEIFSGISLAKRLEAYVPIEQASDAILKRSKQLSLLEKFNSKKQVDHVLEKWPSTIAWLPLKAPEQDMVVLINAQGRPLTTANLKPWD